MEIIYRMNRDFLGAPLVHTIPIVRCSNAHAGSFDTKRYSDFKNHGHLHGTPGHNRSIMINNESYLQVLGKIQEESQFHRVDEDDSVMIYKTTVSLMLWGIVYDFMAFCSSKYAHNPETNNTTAELRWLVKIN